MSAEKIIAVDFDGTLVEHQFPDIGPEVFGAFECLRRLRAAGHRVLLWTIRSGDHLAEAKRFCERREVVFFGVNHNPEQASWSASPKIYAHYYIDDAAVGCPLVRPPGKRPFADWIVINRILKDEGLFL